MNTATETTPAMRVLEQIEREGQMMPLHSAHADAIAKTIPGWSGQHHHLFFSSVMAALPELKSILILGVYQGRDIALISNCAKGRELSIVGVDKFSDTPCADWPEAQRIGGASWRAAGFPDAPTMAGAYEKLTPRLPETHKLQLIQADDAEWLELVRGQNLYDLIYLDTSHDEATVIRQLGQIKPLCHATTLIAGDDYKAILPTWGVEKAVTASFKEHHVLADTIWFADAGESK